MWDLWFFGLIPILLIALFFYLVLRIIWAVFRGMGRLLGLGDSPRNAGTAHDAGWTVGTAAAGRWGTRICPNPRCRRANVTAARYCAQCGRRLWHPRR